MKFLVTGATGNVGRHVVDGLLREGQSVRAMSRRPEKAGLPSDVSVVHGDLGKPETMVEALDGIERMFLFSMDGDTPLRTAPEIMVKAREAGVRRIVVLSGDYEDRAVERAVESSGLEWTFLRPMEFMLNTLDWADQIASEGVVRAPFGEWPSAMIHEADIADVAVSALVEDGHDRRIYKLTGPEVIKRRDAVATIGKAIGKEVRFEELTVEQARSLWKEEGYPEQVIEWLLGMGMEQPEEVRTPVSTVLDVTGHPARTFTQWCAEHAEDFR